MVVVVGGGGAVVVAVVCAAWIRAKQSSADELCIEGHPHQGDGLTPRHVERLIGAILRTRSTCSPDSCWLLTQFGVCCPRPEGWRPEVRGGEFERRSIRNGLSML